MKRLLNNCIGRSNRERIALLMQCAVLISLTAPVGFANSPTGRLKHSLSGFELSNTGGVRPDFYRSVNGLGKGSEQQCVPQKIESPVEFMWSLLPENIVRDNFGKGVNRNFYAIEIVIENSTSNKVLVTGGGFRPQKGGLAVQGVPFAGLNMVLKMAKDDARIRLSEIGFGGRLLVDPNNQIRTVAFVPRHLFGIIGSNVIDDSNEVRRRLGRMALVIAKVGDSEEILDSSALDKN